MTRSVGWVSFTHTVSLCPGAQQSFPKCPGLSTHLPMCLVPSGSWSFDIRGTVQPAWICPSCFHHGCNPALSLLLLSTSLLFSLLDLGTFWCSFLYVWLPLSKRISPLSPPTFFLSSPESLWASQCPGPLPFLSTDLLIPGPRHRLTAHGSRGPHKVNKPSASAEIKRDPGPAGAGKSP